MGPGTTPLDTAYLTIKRPAVPGGGGGLPFPVGRPLSPAASPGPSGRNRRRSRPVPTNRSGGVLAVEVVEWNRRSVVRDAGIAQEVVAGIYADGRLSSRRALDRRAVAAAAAISMLGISIVSPGDPTTCFSDSDEPEPGCETRRRRGGVAGIAAEAVDENATAGRRRGRGPPRFRRRVVSRTHAINSMALGWEARRRSRGRLRHTATLRQGFGRRDIRPRSHRSARHARVVHISRIPRRKQLP